MRLVDDHHLTATLLQILDQEERAQAAHFSFERDRVHFIQAHGILRQILANYSHADEANLAFAHNCHGKPYLIPLGNGPIFSSASRTPHLLHARTVIYQAIGMDVVFRRPWTLREAILHQQKSAASDLDRVGGAQLLV